MVAIAIHHYRRKGQLPLSVVLDPEEDCQDYHRSLNLRDALAEVRYKRDGVTFTREAFASAPDQVMAFRFAADLFFAGLGDSSDEDEADPLAEILANEFTLVLVRHL